MSHHHATAGHESKLELHTGLFDRCQDLRPAILAEDLPSARITIQSAESSLYQIVLDSNRPLLLEYS